MGDEEGRIRRTGGGWLAGAWGAFRSPRPVAVSAPKRPEVPGAADAEAGRNESTGLGSLPADPRRRLPPGMAKLLVQPARTADGRSGYLLTGTADDSAPLSAAGPHLPPTDIRLSRLQQQGSGDGTAAGMPSEVYRAVRHWSQQSRQRPLVAWLTDLRARHGEALHLVVWDDTEFEIPWELLTLPPADDPAPAAVPPARGPDPAPPGGVPLGAVVPVARWTTTCEEAAPLLTGPADCAGGVLSYFDADMAGDSEAFRHVAHRPCATRDDFLAALGGAGDTPTGLVYLGAHGKHGASLENLSLGGLTWYELNEQAMPALAAGGTAVVLNVCHAGRVVANHGGGEDALRGFTELFLRGGATACVAVGGAVDDTIARELLAHLMDHTGRTPERSLALMLRDFRARATDTLPHPLPRARGGDGTVDLRGQRAVLRFLYPFMYVYYGHPHTTLRLSPSAADGAA
ncbi:CHAT domain-containing protein [Streptomyces sp. NPDC004031]